MPSYNRVINAKLGQSIIVKSNEIARRAVVGRFGRFCVEEVEVRPLGVCLHCSERGHIEGGREVAAADRGEGARLAVAEEIERVRLGWFLDDWFRWIDVETHLGEGRALGGGVCLEHA